MNKNAIKKFAIDARNKLIASVTDKAGMLGITKDACSESITKGADFEVYKTTAGTEVTLNKKQCEHRRKLVEQIKARGFDAVIEEVAYTWFNRICAIRFMEVNDYMYPARVRVLSSEKAGKNEPDILTLAPDIDWEFTEEEREYIIDAKMKNKLDDLFRMLFIKQCNLLHEVLPGLFEETEDYTEMLLNISFTNEDDVIRILVDGIDESDFNITTVGENGKQAGQVEIIGWLYQYYNTEPKNKAFAKKGKITKEEVPAVTQLFTPDWIVRYMVENSLGRLWVEGHPDADLQGKWKYYLEEAEQEPQVQAELAKIREEYAKLKPEDIKLIDPCMGSGHILVYAFDVFMQIYENAGWSAREAAQSIVENNIYGLDIDDRAAQLSYFAVMMKARQYDRRIFTRGVRPNVYAIQESNGINQNQLKYFGAELDEMERNTAIMQIEGLLDTLTDAKEYGSILNVDEYDWDLLRRFVNSMDVDGQISFDTYGLDETAEKLKELIEIGAIMAQKYEVVATNPPYMGSRGGMNPQLYKVVNECYPDSKADLYSVFIEKCSCLVCKKGFQAMITQQGWMFLTSFDKLREKLLNMDIISLLHLGARAFDEIGGEVVQTASFVFRKSDFKKYIATYCRLLDGKSENEKQCIFFEKTNRFYVSKEKFNVLSEKSIAYWLSSNMFAAFSNCELGKIAKPRQGMATSDNNRFLRLWNEVDWNKVELSAQNEEQAIKSAKKWFPYNKGGGFRKWYGNNDYLINWENNGQEIKALATGNPYIKEKMDLDVQVSKLKLLKANHTSQIYRLESDIAKNFPVQISALKERIAGMQVDSQVVKSVDLQDNDTFAMTVGNVLYEDKKEAGEALIAACAGLKTVSTGGKVGEYHGFTLSASYNMFSNAFELTVKGKCSYKLEIGKDPVGNMQRIHNTLSSIDRKLTESEQKLETVQQQLATAQEEVKKPFPKEAELNEKMERLSELNALLNMDEKGNETIMADEDIGREGSSTDSRDAVEEKELPETADRIHKPSILERLKQEKAQQNTAEQPPVQKTAKKKHEQEL